MKGRIIKVLMAKPGLDGHESGAKVIARALADAGMEVVYTGIRQMPQMIVSAALQEGVDVVGLSILSGAHMQLCSRIVSLLREKDAGDLPVILGGIIPDRDIPELKRLGIRGVFGPGTATAEVVRYVQGLVGDGRACRSTGEDEA
jgi:methylmalonyl-CoA mutase C-terminal domain/subunit